MHKLGFLSMFLFGIGVLVAPEGYIKKHIYMDFTSVRWFLGPLCILLGFLWLYANKKAKKEYLGNLYCPKCKKPYRLTRNNPIEKCPVCQVKLLKIDEYLEFINK